jgi:phage FluMu protein Com
MTPLRDVRCPECGRLLFRAVGEGTVVEIKCKCSRVVRVT